MNTPQVDLNTHPLKGSSLIEASAGTGKTYTITHLYLRCLLEKQIPVEQMLVVTFTNAATQELKGRIQKQIYKVRNYLKNLDEQDDELDGLFKSYRQDTQAIALLQKALINFDEAAIYSIHGFCQRILTRFSVETGSLLQQQIIADEKELLRSAIRDYWRRHIIAMDLDRLQWIQGLWPEPDKLLNDALPLINNQTHLPGTAQPTDEDLQHGQLERLWYKLQQHWLTHSEQIRSILIDNPALNKQRVQAKTVQKLLQQCEELFSQNLPYELPAKWELLTTQKLKQCLKKDQHDERIEMPFFYQAGEFDHHHQSWIRQQKIALLQDAAACVQKQVDEIKKNALNISFNDLVNQLSDALKTVNPSLAQKITDEYPVAMVDEFQDTDYRQYFIFDTLYRNHPDKTLIMIGDPKQAIYSFRGADVFTYQQAKAATSKQFTLSTNYRSCELYIDVVNQLFEHNPDAFVLKQLIEFNKAGFNAGNKKELFEENGVALPLVSWILPFSEKPASKATASEYFAQCCASEIDHILQEQSLRIGDKPAEARDLTILVKTGRQASLMKQKLAERGISSALLLRDSVFATEQAREISLLLEVLIDPSDIRRLNGLLTTDLFGWNAAQIARLQNDNDRLVDLLEQMKRYQQHWLNKGVLSMFFLLLQEHNSIQINLAVMEGERRITNWLHIMELLQQQASQHASPSQALHWLRKQRQAVDQVGDIEDHQLRLESDSNLVRIVTIHKSKGLEYPIVFLPFMWDVKSQRSLPHCYSVHDEAGHKQTLVYDESQGDRWHQENLAEEVRLFYVAMTRARYRCYLAWGHINGAGSSAIAQCLYAGQIKAGRPPRNLAVSDREALYQPFVDMNQGRQRVKIIEQERAPIAAGRELKKEIQTTEAREFKRKVERQWFISSYSQIASRGQSGTVDRPDYDAIYQQSLPPAAEPAELVLNRFSFPKGAKAGTFLHDILEHSVFDQAVDEVLITEKCREYGYAEHWISVVKNWIQEILNCDLDGFRLCDIRPDQKICEMEFYLSSNRLDHRDLNRLLHENGYLNKGIHFDFADITGFLKGFIDLVFEQQGRYFIADYKSNHLGSELQDYDPVHCDQAMHEHHYHLQYLIYIIALHRYLKQRLPDYDYEQHIGGAYYLFLRGMSVQENSTMETTPGVFFHKPACHVIEQLDLCFQKD